MGKNTGRVGEFCQSGKVGTMQINSDEKIHLFLPPVNVRGLTEV